MRVEHPQQHHRQACATRTVFRVAIVEMLLTVDAIARLGWLQLGDRRADAEVLLPAQTLVQEGLVDDHIQTDGSLSDLTIADDQLSLAQTDRHHGVHGGHTGQQRAVHGLTGDDTRGISLNWATVAQLQRHGREWG